MVDLRQNEDEDVYDPFNDGWNERIAEKQKGDNPFGINNWKFYEWEKGWLEADKTIKKQEKQAQ